MGGEKEHISQDEKDILEGWRMVKRHRKGHLRVELKSDGTQFYLEITPAKIGRIYQIQKDTTEQKKTEQKKS